LKINTFFQFCVYICICLIGFNLAFIFVTTAQYLGDTHDTGPFDLNLSNASENFETITQGESTGNIWNYVLGVGAVAGVLASIAIGIATSSTNVMGIGIFSTVFWTSYGSTLATVTSSSLLSGLEGFIMIGTVIMFFLWIGAIIGMLSGSG